MTEDGFDNETASDGGQAITRREAIRKGAVVGGTALWVAPMVQNIGIARAFGQSASPVCHCNSESFDATAILKGKVTEDFGPIRAFPLNGNDCVSDTGASFAIPGRPPFVTGSQFCVGGDHTGSGCSAFARLAQVAVDLRNINTSSSPGPFDVQLTAEVLESEARCICGGGGCTLRSCTGDVVLTVAGNSRTIDSCTPNREVPINITGILEGKLVINEQVGCSANAVHLTLVALPGNSMFQQSIEIILAHASATCHN